MLVNVAYRGFLFLKVGNYVLQILSEKKFSTTKSVLQKYCQAQLVPNSLVL